jgi:protein TonB
MKLNSLVFCIAGVALAATSASAQAPSSRIKDAGSMSLPLSAYPERARERGEEGTVEYRVDVDRDGALRSCEIIKSSGHSQLDQATCELMIQHVKFAPDVNEEGRPLESIFQGTIVWKLPDSETNG